MPSSATTKPPPKPIRHPPQKPTKTTLIEKSRQGKDGSRLTHINPSSGRREPRRTAWGFRRNRSGSPPSRISPTPPPLANPSPPPTSPALCTSVAVVGSSPESSQISALSLSLSSSISSAHRHKPPPSSSPGCRPPRAPPLAVLVTGSSGSPWCSSVAGGGCASEGDRE
ncbi:hypothetical protein Dimus_038868 [Dionaea muscipula]